jgi:hypothetical protein
MGPLARSAGQRVNALLRLFYLVLRQNAIGEKGNAERRRGCRSPWRRLPRQPNGLHRLAKGDEGNAHRHYGHDHHGAGRALCGAAKGQRAHEGTHEWLQLRRGCVLDSALLASGDWQVRAFRPADVALR